MTKDGRQVYIAATGSSAITWLRREIVSGALSFDLEAGVGGFVRQRRLSDSAADASVLNGLDGVNSIDTSYDGRHLYAVADKSEALTWFSRTAATGDLTYLGELRQNENWPGGNRKSATSILQSHPTHF